MSGTMNISCIQMDMEFCSPDKNFEKAKALIEKAAASRPDVIVLPETWNTGFFPRENLESYCDKDGSRTKSEIGGLAKKLKINIVAGSVANIKENKVYNTAYVFDREGKLVCEYDKTHLFSPMDEDNFFAKGEKVCNFTLDGKACGIIICYDIRFPELARTLAIKGLDCLFVVAQWPSVRIPHLKALAKARAIENQTYVVCCNSCGKAGDTVFGGNSRVVDPWGEELCTADGNESVMTAECDLLTIENIRNTINVFADRRAELYDLN